MITTRAATVWGAPMRTFGGLLFLPARLIGAGLFAQNAFGSFCWNCLQRFGTEWL